MNMGSLTKYQNRRVMGDKGWLYFCRQCGDYFPYDDFYKRKNTAWGINSSCKKHRKKIRGDYEYDKNIDMSHMKLQPITEDDWLQVRAFMGRLGYKYDSEKTIHEQFCEKHGLKPRIRLED